MRPLLSVVLVPSMPMNEERLSTAGILQDYVGECLLARGHGGEGNVLRAFGNAQNHAGVLHREKSFGDDRCTAEMVATSVATVTSRVILRYSQDDLERAAVGSDDAIEGVFRFAVEPAFVFAVDVLQQFGAHHRRERERYER